MTGTWPARLVASILPLVTPAWSNSQPRPLAHLRQNPLSQLSQVSQVSHNLQRLQGPRQRLLIQPTFRSLIDSFSENW